MTTTLPHFVSSLPPGEAVPCLGRPDAAAVASSALINQRDLSKLRWRCRRGLLENDLFIERFFTKFEKSLTVNQAKGLNVLMDLSDNDLLDLHLARKTLDQLVFSSPALDCSEAREVLKMLQNKA
jgi:antitoxin CptB